MSYINGGWVDDDGKEFVSENPHTKEKLSSYNGATEEQVREAVRVAEEAQDSWSELSMIDRAEYLWEINNELKNNVEEYGEIVTKECGKEISEGKADVREAQHMTEFAASLSRQPIGDVIPSEISDKDSYMIRQPKGTIGSITPWNFPIAIPMWHICIPLVFGNTIVFKPSELTPYCGEIVASLFEELPDGVFNMVQGSGRPTGEALTSDKRVDCIQFTGSAEVGWSIQKKVSDGRTAACEMGGKNAVVVTDEADLEKAVKCSLLSSFKTTGQRCVSSERLIVHESVYDEFKERFLDMTRNIRVGNPLDESTFMGPLVNKAQVEKFEKYNGIAKDEGANVLLERNVSGDGYHVGPFVYEMEWDNSKRCLTEEVFGPHVALIEYSGGVENAIQISNDVDYGLAGSIITQSHIQANKYRDNAELGLMYHDLPCIGAEVHLPFGGVKKSGNGAPSGRGVIDICTHKTAWTQNNSEDIELAQGLSDDIN